MIQYINERAYKNADSGEVIYAENKEDKNGVQIDMKASENESNCQFLFIKI